MNDGFIKHRETIERMLIAIFLKHSDLFTVQMLKGLNASHFSGFDTGAVYNAMVEMDEAGEPVNVSSLAIKLPMFVREIEQLARVEIAEYGQGTIDKLVAELYQINKQAALMHKASDLYNQLGKRKPYDLEIDQYKVIDDFYNGIEKQDLKSGSTVDMREATERALKSLEDNCAMGLHTGFKYLDRYTGGFQPGSLIILGARPSVGKSAFIFNLVNNMIHDARPLVFSLEMSTDELVHRQFANLGNVNSMRYMHGDLSDDEIDRTHTAASKLIKQDVLVNDDPNLKLEDICKEIRWHVHRSNRNIVYIDHHDLIFTKKKMADRRMEVSFCAVALKNLAKELKIPIVLAAQLKRPAEAYINRRPTKFELKESSALEQSANVVLLLHREVGAIEDKDRMLAKDEAEIIIDKCRNGITGVFKIKHDLRYNRFMDGNYNDGS